MSVAQILARSSNVGAVTIGLELGRQPIQPLDRSLRLRPPDRRPVPGRGTGNRAGAEGLLGLDDGQPADGPGGLGDADADGCRLHGDRRRRHPAPPAADREGRRRAGARAARAPRHRPSGGGAGARQCSRGCWRRGDRLGGERARATRLPARPGPRRLPKTGPTPKPNSWPPSSALLRRRTRDCWSR